MLRSTFQFLTPAKNAVTPVTADSVVTSSASFTTRLSKQKFASPWSLKVFARPIQEQLRDHLSARQDIKALPKSAAAAAAAAAKKQRSASKNKNKKSSSSAISVTKAFQLDQIKNLDRFQYWLSFPQALRQFNTMPRFGQKPAVITNGATRIVPLSALKDSEEHYVVQNHPPFFNSGVGIFFDFKWHRVQAQAMARHLNPNREQRKLFIDMDSVEDLHFTVQQNFQPLELKGICDRSYFCADQMEKPHKIFPTRGLALNPTTARRYTQPAHDVLMTASLLRGYVSPYWLTEAQITRYFKVAIDPKCKGDFVEIPGRLAALVKLSALKKEMRQEIIKQYPPPPTQDREALTVALDGGNWEIVLHQNVLTTMSSKSESSDEMELWVSVSMLRYMFQDWNRGTVNWAFPNCQDKHEAKELAHFLNSTVGPDNWIDQASVTTMKVYNAEATTNPKAINPQMKNVAICAGRPIHHRSLPTVIKAAYDKNYLSPVWLTPLDTVRIPNLAIQPGERPLELTDGTATAEHMYNIDDLEDESVKKFLNEFPPPSDSNKKPYIFIVKNWSPILSPGKIKSLQNTEKKRQLWFKHSEVVFHALSIKEDVEAVALSANTVGRKSDRSKDRGRGEVRRLFNAIQTTDPVRVCAMSLMKSY